MYKIYKVTNKLNSKVYIGQTKNTIEYRFKQHMSIKRQYAYTKWHYAVLKYGKENFKLELIIDNIPTKKLANIEEKYYIKLYDSKINGYNSSDGGEFWADNTGKVSCYDMKGNRFSVKINDDRLGISIFPIRTGSHIQKKTKRTVFRNYT